MSAPVPEDMGRARLSAALDELGERVFGGRDGARRAAPLLERWDREVGVHTSVDSGHEALAAARVDWALCDAEPPGAAPGDTWAWRAATGRVPGIEPTPLYRLLATTQAGIFEVWPGTPLLLRDRLRGLSVRVDEPAPWLGSRGGRPRCGSCAWPSGQAWRGSAGRRSSTRWRSRRCCSGPTRATGERRSGSS
ncbi:hypothetical protein [Nannocystis pusilla]|uniref:hypothetical protein n=1 Tax=Nannocystis pusilla TaxID=889268 RepID=UPI003B82774C